MPNLDTLRDERRKAENDLKLLKARVRLIKDTTFQNEMKLRQERKQQALRETIQGDANWMRETVEQEFIKREMENSEKQKQAAEMRLQTKQYLNQSKKMVLDAKAEAARKQREDTQYKLDAAYEQKKLDWQRKRQMADDKRKHSEWYKGVSTNAAKEFADRSSEMRLMAIAEEETRTLMLNERREQILDALEREEHRLNKVKEDRIRVARLVSSNRDAVGNGDVSLMDDPQLEDDLTVETITAKPTKYHISGPGMATVVRSGAIGGGRWPNGQRRRSHGGRGMQNISPAMLRVHFPFDTRDQDKFAFDAGALQPNHNRNSLRQSGTFRGNSFTGKKF